LGTATPHVVIAHKFDTRVFLLIKNAGGEQITNNAFMLTLSLGSLRKNILITMLLPVIIIKEQ